MYSEFISLSGQIISIVWPVTGYTVVCFLNTVYAKMHRKTFVDCPRHEFIFQKVKKMVTTVTTPTF